MLMRTAHNCVTTPAPGWESLFKQCGKRRKHRSTGKFGYKTEEYNKRGLVIAEAIKDYIRSNDGGTISEIAKGIHKEPPTISYMTLKMLERGELMLDKTPNPIGGKRRHLNLYRIAV